MEVQTSYNQTRNRNSREKYSKNQYGKVSATSNRYQNIKQNGKSYQSRAAPQYPYAAASYQSNTYKLVRKGSCASPQPNYFRQFSNLPPFFFFDNLNAVNSRPVVRETPEKLRRPYQTHVIFVENADKSSELHGFKIVQNGQIICDEISNQTHVVPPNSWELCPKVDKFAGSVYLTGPNEKMISIPSFVETME